LIDDGLATGSTMRAAVAALRNKNPARIVVAVPIGAASTCAELRSIADDCICAIAPEHFRAVGLWYDDFAQTDDAEVCDMLNRTTLAFAPWEGGSVMSPIINEIIIEREVAIPAGERTVRGTLALPRGARAVIVFAHGSGSGRDSPRNRYVAQVLQEAGLGTLLLDLLEPQEADDRRNVFDIPLLAGRLQAAADWLAQQVDTKGLALGFFGACTGAGAALLAAARAPESVGAVVSRGGRPDLASDVLPDVNAPTLLIVGGDDEVVLELNREAFNLLTCTRQLDIVPGATHLFVEPGALEQVARLAQEWFVHYVTKES